MVLRNDITVRGVPGTWTTNLSDDDIRTFHEAFSVNDGEELAIEVMTWTFKFKYVSKTLPFKEGACLWHNLNDKNWVLYRTHYEWEIWSARKRELDELKEEQEQEREVMTQLMRTENDHLSQLAKAAILAKNYDKAEQHLIARAELAREIDRLKLNNWWSYGIIENVSRWFANFPFSDNGIEFLKKYDCRANSFLAYARHYVYGPRRQNADDETQMQKVFDAAVSLFPSDGYLFKETCLFWRRRGRLDLAIKYCGLAVERGLADETKTGFIGRLQRLNTEVQRLARAYEHSLPK